MLILEDTRQQANKHDLKHRWFHENGILVNRVTLSCGDYQLPGFSKVAIDTKKDIQELIGDIQFKAISVSVITSRIKEISCMFHLDECQQKDLISLIKSDDSERFPEAEITDFCIKNHLPDEVNKAATELYLKRHGFFHRGLLRAKNYGVKLYILVENQDGISDIRSLFSWVNPRRKIMVRTKNIIGYNRNGSPKYQFIQKYPNCMMGSTLAKACITMEKKYGCRFAFCKPEEAGQTIVALLGGDGDGE